MQSPSFILFIQHGLSDHDEPFLRLARQLPVGQAIVRVPQLDTLRTWLRIAPLIDAVEEEVAGLLREHPDTPLRIIGHSMGGLIWLELFSRQPDWLARVQSLVLLASPVAGANLARGVDPFGWGIGIARDLSIDRRPLGEVIAKTVPTVTIAGGADRVVQPAETQIAGATFVCLPGLSHTDIRDHWMTAAVIRRFWEGSLDTGSTGHAVAVLRAVPGILTAHSRDVPRARVEALLTDGGTIQTWTNPLGFLHAFIVDRAGQLCFGGFVRPAHTGPLRQAITSITRQWSDLTSL